MNQINQLHQQNNNIKAALDMAKQPVVNATQNATQNDIVQNKINPELVSHLTTGFVVLTEQNQILNTAVKSVTSSAKNEFVTHSAEDMSKVLVSSKQIHNTLNSLKIHTDKLSTAPLNDTDTAKYMSPAFVNQLVLNNAPDDQLLQDLHGSNNNNVLTAILVVMIEAISNANTVVGTAASVIVANQKQEKYLNNVEAAMADFKGVLPVYGSDGKTPITSMYQLFQDAFNGNPDNLPDSELASLKSAITPFSVLLGPSSDETSFNSAVSNFMNQFNTNLEQVGSADASPISVDKDGNYLADANNIGSLQTSAQNGVAAASSLSSQSQMYMQSDSQALTAFIQVANQIVQQIGTNNSMALRSAG